MFFGFVGNDLARCLGWGGGLHAIMQKGMQYLLQDIQKNAIVGLLDRWNVHIIPSEPPSSPSKAKLKIMGGFSQEPQKVVSKNKLEPCLSYKVLAFAGKISGFGQV